MSTVMASDVPSGLLVLAPHFPQWLDASLFPHEVLQAYLQFSGSKCGIQGSPSSLDSL